jgi:hypothetical protein
MSQLQGHDSCLSHKTQLLFFFFFGVGSIVLLYVRVFLSHETHSQSSKTIPARITDRSETTARTGHRQFSSELHCQSCNAQSFCPLVHFISLSLSDLFWLLAHAPCLLYYNSPQSCTVRAITLRVSARWSTSSLSLS